MIQIVKTLFHSSLFYAGFIWINNQSLEEIAKLHYQILKTIIGAVFNVRTSVAHMILGIAPLEHINKCNLIKHYLKLMLNETPADKMKEFLAEDLRKEENKSVMFHPIKQVMKFLGWKIAENRHRFDVLFLGVTEILRLGNPKYWEKKFGEPF